MKKLFFVSAICFIFMVCEFVGGIISNSLAILADAAHMFSDVAGFMISFFAIYIAQNKATFGKSMGYHRAEIIGALGSIFIIWGLLVWLNIEATNRLITPPNDIEPNIMLITAIIGFICNVVNFVALNCGCGETPGDDEEESDLEDLEYGQSNNLDSTINDSLEKSGRSIKSKYSLADSLSAVYKPRQFHNCIRAIRKTSNVSKDDFNDSQKTNSLKREAERLKAGGGNLLVIPEDDIEPNQSQELVDPLVSKGVKKKKDIKK